MLLALGHLLAVDGSLLRHLDVWADLDTVYTLTDEGTWNTHTRVCGEIVLLLAHTCAHSEEKCHVCFECSF